MDSNACSRGYSGFLTGTSEYVFWDIRNQEWKAPMSPGWGFCIPVREGARGGSRDASRGFPCQDIPMLPNLCWDFLVSPPFISVPGISVTFWWNLSLSGGICHFLVLSGVIPGIRLPLMMDSMILRGFHVPTGFPGYHAFSRGFPWSSLDYRLVGSRRCP